jgi:tetratricopeptide (TPR) repeat protein
MSARPTPSVATAQLIQRVLASGRAGDAAGARAAAQAGLRGGEAAEVFHALLGALDCQAGRMADGIAHFRAALAIRPDDVAVRGNLVRALLDSGDAAAALAVCTAEHCAADRSQKLLRLRGYLLQQSGAHEEAAAAYRDIVATNPTDYESWNNLGNALAASGHADEGLAAIARAAALQPGNAPVRFNHAATLVQLGRAAEAEAALLKYASDFPADVRPRVELAALCKLSGRDADALQWLEQAALLAPRDADLAIKLGLERQFAWQMDGAGEAFAHAVSLQPSLDEAHVLLALHLEHLNRTAGFADLVSAAQAGGAGAGTLHFLRALLFRREGNFAAALAELDGVPADLEPIRVAQLRGQCHDRLNDADRAFAEFTRMNELQRADVTEPARRAREYREALARDRALVTPEWYAGWRREPLPAGRTPVFLLGFPRSGTTLLDTMLMGHPAVQVLEERPPIAKVEQELGGIHALPALGAADILRLREVYFAEARRWIDLREDSLLVDKFPLHLNKVPIIHRLFPEARFVLALRHPLDVLLSCYITNFRLNSAMSNFLELQTAAWVYDQSFGFWEQSRRIMGVDSRTVVYERMVEDSARELQPLFAWLGLPWTEQVLDHQRTAAGRGVITTASYAQVTEPVYTRARGRWHKYRRHLESVIPAMQPWVEQHGYEL